MLGYPSLTAWWNEPMNCSQKDFIRAINGTLQTRIPHRSMDLIEVSTWKRRSGESERDALESFDCARWIFPRSQRVEITLLRCVCLRCHLDLGISIRNPSERESDGSDRFSWCYSKTIRSIFSSIRWVILQGRVRFSHGERVGEILVEQYVGTSIVFFFRLSLHCSVTQLNNHSMSNDQWWFMSNSLLWRWGAL